MTRYAVQAAVVGPAVWTATTVRYIHAPMSAATAIHSVAQPPSASAARSPPHRGSSRSSTA